MIDEAIGEILPPHSIGAEQAVIGGILLDNSAYFKVVERLSYEDFYQRDHQLIFWAIGQLARKDQPFDIITLSDFLTKKNRIEEVGGLAYLGVLAKNTPSAANIVAYAGIVQDRSVSRKLLALCGEISAAVHGDKSAAEALAMAETAIFNMAQSAIKGKKGAVRLKELLRGVVDGIQERFENPPQTGLVGTTTGFVDLDKLLTGMGGGDLDVIAARPGMGKTSLAMNIVEAAAVSGVPAVVFSLEMPAEQLAARMLAGASSLDSKLLKESWRFADPDFTSLGAGVCRLGELPVWVDDTPGVTALEVRARCMRLQSEVKLEHPAGLGLIVIDYVQLMGSDVKDANRNNQIEETTRTLKKMAKEFGVPVILLSQLNRECERRPNKRPTLADLRDSGAVEQDADVVMFIYRDEVYNEDSHDAGTAEVIIAKHRNGGLGTVRLAFDAKCVRFRNLEYGGYHADSY